MSTASGQCRRFDGKVAVVTASTEGIGLAIAERLGSEGAKVVVSSRKQKNVDAAVEKLTNLGQTVIGLVCHVASKEDRRKLLQQAAEKFGGIDILVSNAAVNPAFGPLFDTTEETWDKIFDVNVKATFFLCKEVIPYMEKRGGGSIVVVSSVGGYTPMEGIAAYSVSKTTLLGMVKAMSIAVSSQNIRVNGIAPGVVKTKFSHALWQAPEVAVEVTNQVPLARLGVPEDCAGTVAFLASDDASYVTGETVVVAGGMTSRL
jgi:dehydrogenase/reductase SDR family protein 4